MLSELRVLAGHGGQDWTVKELSNRYKIVTLRDNENSCTITRCHQQKQLKYRSAGKVCVIVPLVSYYKMAFHLRKTCLLLNYVYSKLEIEWTCTAT